MSHLAALAAAALAVEVYSGAHRDRLLYDAVREEEVVCRRGGRTEEVEHTGGGRGEGYGREGNGEDCEEVGGVLGEVAGFDGVVARVVRAGSDLVEKKRACARC